jgi:hypothetical protein
MTIIDTVTHGENSTASAREREGDQISKETVPNVVNESQSSPKASETAEGRTVPEARKMRVFSWHFGLVVIGLFFMTFIAIMVVRGTVRNRPRGFNLFANLYLAGKQPPSRLSA